MIEKLIYNDLISLNHRYRDQTNLLEVLSQYLLQKCYVKTEFSKAILQREKDYPTGLQLENMAVAIPHTYSEYVLKPFIYINKLKEPISFIQMGTEDEIVMARYVIVLGISNPKDQAGLLAELMTLFSNPKIVQQLEMAQTKEALKNIFN